MHRQRLRSFPKALHFSSLRREEHSRSGEAPCIALGLGVLA